MHDSSGCTKKSASIIITGGGLGRWGSVQNVVSGLTDFNNFSDFLFGTLEPFQKGSTLKGKKLLLEQQDHQICQ